ncbi:hypothetical protein WFP14_03795 [Yersinia proxima]|uniref:Uncharacterized protein n=2 Tax=Yersinia proxima TaxID=2890316 RepID=A0ABW9EUS3_9GAMM|nr:Uncharacterised protein [Yersinia intermedia]
MIPTISNPTLYSANNINLEEDSIVFFSVSSQQKKLVKKITQITNDQFIIELYIKIRSSAENKTQPPIINKVRVSFVLNHNNFDSNQTASLMKGTIGANKPGARKSSLFRAKRKSKKSLNNTNNISIRHESFIKATCRYFLFYRKKNRHEILDILL